MQKLITTVESYLSSVKNITDVIIAYSGGVDSHVLLHVCSTLKGSFNFKAIYIDHGLHEDSKKWSAHCQHTAESLSINFISEAVNAANVNGDGPEQAARQARYAALSKHCSDNTLLLVAQHQDDQAETLMLQLLRGAGVKGLASMPRLAAFGKGYLGRPFLELSQQTILDYAAQHQLSWVEDSSNLELTYDRNFLRQQVVPLIQQRWPAFAQTTARTASHCAEASSILDDYASTLLVANDSADLSVSSLDGETDQVKRLVIRQWLANNAVRMPSEKILHQLVSLLAMDVGQSACVAWAQYQVRLYNGNLYFSLSQSDVLVSTDYCWQFEQVELPGRLGMLRKKPVVSGGISEQYWLESRVSVRFRVGGERIKLAGSLGRKKLKKLYNEAKIFPWVRNDIPLIYIDDELVAVADLWLDERYLAKDGGVMYQVEWTHPKFRIQ